MTGPELNRLSGAVRFMELHCRPKRGLWWLSTNRGTGRRTIGDIQKRVTKLQVEHGLRPYNVTTFESRGGLHAHIVFLGNREIVERLRGSTAFGDLIQVDPVTDPAGTIGAVVWVGSERRVRERVRDSVVPASRPGGGPVVGTLSGTL